MMSQSIRLQFLGGIMIMIVPDTFCADWRSTALSILKRRRSASSTSDCSVKTGTGNREEHQVVGQHSEVALARPGGVGPTAEGGPEPAVVPTECGLSLPPLPYTRRRR